MASSDRNTEPLMYFGHKTQMYIGTIERMSWLIHKIAEILFHATTKVINIAAKLRETKAGGNKFL